MWCSVCGLCLEQEPLSHSPLLTSCLDDSISSKFGFIACEHSIAGFAMKQRVKNVFRGSAHLQYLMYIHLNSVHFLKKILNILEVGYILLNVKVF
jgi:hypothetical protein